MISINFLKGYREIYASGTVGGYSKGEFKINFYTHIETDEEGKTTVFVPVTVVLTPYAAKELARWLSEKVREYEEKHGEIEEEDIEKIREIEKRYKEIEESYDVEEEEEEQDL